jgi:hypothetical protein
VLSEMEVRAELSSPLGEASVPLRDLQDFLTGVGVDQVGVIGSDVRLNLLDQIVLGLGFDGRATRAVDLHAVLPRSWSARLYSRACVPDVACLRPMKVLVCGQRDLHHASNPDSYDARGRREPGPVCASSVPARRPYAEEDGCLAAQR